MSQGCWIGCDLDGTLAIYDGWKGPLHIGEPIPAMVSRVRDWIEKGATVKILTARVAHDEDGSIVREIENWCEKHLGIKLDVTSSKDYGMVALYDDRGVQVETNTGKIVSSSHINLPEWVFINEQVKLPENKPTNYNYALKNGRKHYVVGFLFDHHREYVALITKNKPQWQANKLNGIGGKVEIGESAYDAMVREFYEETGATVKDWKHFATLSGNYSYIDIYSAFAMDSMGWVFSATEREEQSIVWPVTTTDEEVEVYPIKDLHRLPTLPNIQWLVPLALSIEKDTCKDFIITEASE